tara:strand:- start:1444 stop:1908 length:465 start_codon:yes stop_codon:yes gene_type:complete
MKAQDLAVFTAQFMDETAEIMAGRIVLDADDGKFQNNKKNLKYKSAEYKLRKKAGKALSGKKRGVSADTQTKFVNMRLSNDTLNRIKGVGTKNGFAITYANGEIVEGNAKRGYDLYGLSDKNMSYLATHLENEIQRKILIYEAQDETINLGKKQ